MPDQDQGFSAEKLTDVLGLLAGGGLAKSILVGPGALRALGGAKSIHPAAAESLGHKGSLTDPLAVAAQRSMDQHVIENYGVYNQLTPSQKDMLHYNYGWQHSPSTGLLSREIPDTNLNVTEEGNYIHPAGDVLGVHGIRDPVIWKPKFNTEREYHSPDESPAEWALRMFKQKNGPETHFVHNPLTWGDYYNKYIGLDPILRSNSEIGGWNAGLLESLKRLGRPRKNDFIHYSDIWRDPNKSLIPGTAATQTQYGIQSANQAHRKPDFSYGEAQAVGRRALYPDLYKEPFYEDFLRE